MPWYNVLRPRKPIVFDGAPAKMGLWVRGASDWGRVIYVLRDAKGERWESIGTRMSSTATIVHSWSPVQLRRLALPDLRIPGSHRLGQFPQAGTNWWRSDDGRRRSSTCRLAGSDRRRAAQPTSMYVERRSAGASDSVSFGKLYVRIQTPEDATPEAIRISRLRMPTPPEAANLPNPVADLERTGGWRRRRSPPSGRPCRSTTAPAPTSPGLRSPAPKPTISGAAATPTAARGQHGPRRRHQRTALHRSAPRGEALLLDRLPRQGRQAVEALTGRQRDAPRYVHGEVASTNQRMGRP